MKLIFSIILLCGITTTPVRTVNTKAKKIDVCHAKETTVKAVTTSLDIDMVPSGLFFQF